MELVDKAKAFSIKSHGLQPYGKGLHTDHLQEVVDTGFYNVNLLASGWLHDVVEDTDVTLEDLINEGFPDTVINIVNAVTNEEGINRKERNEKTYLKIVLLDDSITVKLADRISNVRSTIRDNDSKFAMYKKEYAGFRLALYKKGSVHIPLWNELDKLLLTSKL